jgi:hypothetical protein
MSWKVEVTLDGERWYAREPRFATKREAGWFACDLFCRWNISEPRVVESDDPVNASYGEDGLSPAA